MFENTLAWQSRMNGQPVGWYIISYDTKEGMASSVYWWDSKNWRLTANYENSSSIYIKSKDNYLIERVVCAQKI